MRRKFVAGNWKMNKTISEARQLITELLLTLRSLDGIDRAVCPPSLALPMAAKLLEGTGVGLGAQNMYWEESGAYTGELAPNMVAELCGYVLIGHSERRGYFGETDETVNLKVKAALAHSLTPIVCIGESLEENQAGKTAEVISRQVCAGLAGLTNEDGAKLVIAYEPIWALGTGLAATAEAANAIHRDVVRPALAAIFGGKVAQGI
ncbi:MAG: triose-phosphate isomerase, partial [Chloroflexi bacterium]|nr:triose-phosphate isomerase [Chloroflexota bacterium]